MIQSNAGFAARLVTCVLAAASVGVGQQRPRTAASLFTEYKSACVEVLTVEGNASGSGFIVSPNGLILTANHVVNPSEQLSSPVPGPYPAIKIRLSDGTVVDAKAAQAASTAESVKHDYAFMRISRSTPKYFKLGNWSEAKEGDALTIIGHPLGIRFPTLLAATVAGRGDDDHGVHLILFQAPNNRGLSGSPVICNRTGNVIGIVQNRLVGITPKLFELRQKLLPAPGTTMGGVFYNGLNTTESLIELTNVLDSYLISGMGEAVAIDYAKANAPGNVRQTVSGEKYAAPLTN